MTSRPLLFSLASVASLALLAGCSTAPEVDTSVLRLPVGGSIVHADPVTPSVPVEPSLSIVDPTGVEISLDTIPERIVCVTGICDDILISLGITPVGTTTPALIALPQYLGDAAADVPVIPGGWGNEDVEVIASLEPDLVIGLANAQEGLAESIEQFAPYWLASVETVEDSIGYLRALAALTGKVDEGAKVETALRQAMADAEATSAEYGLKDIPILSMYASSVGSGVNTRETIVGDLLGEYFAYPWETKNGDPATAYTFSNEEILSVDPAAIFITSFVFGADDKTWTEEVSSDPIWSRIDAVSNGKSFEVETALWASGRGPHSLTLVLTEALTKAVG